MITFYKNVSGKCQLHIHFNQTEFHSLSLSLSFFLFKIKDSFQFCPVTLERAQLYFDEALLVAIRENQVFDQQTVKVRYRWIPFFLT